MSWFFVDFVAGRGRGGWGVGRKRRNQLVLTKLYRLTSSVSLRSNSRNKILVSFCKFYFRSVYFSVSCSWRCTSKACWLLYVDSNWNVMEHGDAREGKWKEKLAVGSQYPSHYLGTWCIQHYYRWCRTPLLPAVHWTDAHRPIYIDSSVSHERRNLVSARVPSHFNWILLLMKRLGGERNSFPFSVEVKNRWSYNFTTHIYLYDI